MEPLDNLSHLLDKGDRTRSAGDIDGTTQVFIEYWFTQLLEREPIIDGTCAGWFSRQNRIQADPITQGQVLQGGEIGIITHVVNILSNRWDYSKWWDI